MADELTWDRAAEEIRSFFREPPLVVFGSGTSCALDTGFGMGALKESLLAGIGRNSLTAGQRSQWDAVNEALHRGIDLEHALDAVTDRDLLKRVTDLTGSSVAGLDRKVGTEIAAGASVWPPSRLIREIVESLPEGAPALHMVTPNYDMMLEYSCAHAGIPCTDGFFGGIERTMDWPAALRGLQEPRIVAKGRQRQQVYKFRKHVRLYKVHGSLNYFYHNGRIVANDAWMLAPPPFVERVMVTPGLAKYETIQNYRKELQQPADAAIEKSSRFLFLGYGFNDTHLEVPIRQKLVTGGCYGLIATKDSNPRIEKLMKDAGNLWLVCESRNPSTAGSIVMNSRYSGRLTVPGENIWSADRLMKLVMGELP